MDSLLRLLKTPVRRPAAGAPPATPSPRPEASRSLPQGKGLYPQPPERKADQRDAIAAQLPPGQGNQVVWTDWDAKRAIMEGFKASDWVYGCVQKVASTGCTVPARVGTLDKAGQLEPLGSHPLTDLLAEPNPWQDGQDVLERWGQHLLLAGNALGLKVRVQGQVREVWPIQPDIIKPIADRAKYIDRYEIRVAGNQVIPVDPKDVIHIQIQDPGNPLWGMAPLQALGKIVDTEVDALNWWRNSIRNRAAKDGAFVFKYELTEEQYDLVREQVIEQALGPWNAGIPLIIGNEATYQPFSMTPAEMDWIETRKMTREEICGVFGVPPILMGILENSSYNNIQTARLIFWLDTIIPFMGNIAGALNRAFRAERGQPRNRVYFDFSGVEALMVNYGEKVKIAKDLWTMGTPLNVCNKRLQLGLPADLPGGDEGFIPSTVVPVMGATLAVMQGPAEPVDEPVDEQPADPSQEPDPAIGSKVLRLSARRSLRA